MKTYSEAELNLQPRWFTGSQWADGTAQREMIAEHREAVRQAEKREREPRKKYVPNQKPWEPWWAKTS